MNDDIEYIYDENEVVDCPACGEAYNDADADFLICSKCGWNEGEKKYDRRKISRSMFDEIGNLREDIL